MKTHATIRQGQEVRCGGVQCSRWWFSWGCSQRPWSPSHSYSCECKAYKLPGVAQPCPTGQPDGSSPVSSCTRSKTELFSMGKRSLCSNNLQRKGRCGFLAVLFVEFTLLCQRCHSCSWFLAIFLNWLRVVYLITSFVLVPSCSLPLSL